MDNGIAPIDVQMLTVTRPLEETIRTVPGITTVRSITARGGTEINVFFRWDVDVLNALHLVQGRISQIMPSMPTEARFIINRLTFSVFPMIGFSITSPSRSLADLWELAYYDYAPRLYRLPGVAETRIVGGRPKEYHVIVDPQKLNGYGMPLSKVVDALRATNVIEPAGMMQENYHLYLTTVTGLVRETEQIGDIVVDVVKGTPVQIRNVATVVPGEQPVYNIVTANGRPAVLVNVMQQPDGNSIEIADAVNRELRGDQEDAAQGRATEHLLRPVDPGARLDQRRSGEHSHRPGAVGRRADGLPQELAHDGGGGDCDSHRCAVRRSCSCGCST